KIRPEPLVPGHGPGPGPPLAGLQLGERGHHRFGLRDELGEVLGHPGPLDRRQLRARAGDAHPHQPGRPPVDEAFGGKRHGFHSAPRDRLRPARVSPGPSCARRPPPRREPGPRRPFGRRPFPTAPRERGRTSPGRGRARAPSRGPAERARQPLEPVRLPTRLQVPWPVKVRLPPRLQVPPRVPWPRGWRPRPERRSPPASSQMAGAPVPPPRPPPPPRPERRARSRARRSAPVRLPHARPAPPEPRPARDVRPPPPPTEPRRCPPLDGPQGG